MVYGIYSKQKNVAVNIKFILFILKIKNYIALFYNLNNLLILIIQFLMKASMY